MEDGDVQGRVVRPMEDGDVQGRVVRPIHVFTFTMALLPYDHVYCGSVVLLLLLPWTSPSSKGHTTLPTRPCASQPFHAPLHSSKQPLSTPAWPSLPLPGPTQSPPFHCPCLHLYPGPVALLPRLLWPCCLISTSTMALLPYYHVYCGPIALLPPLLWSCCLVYFQHPFSIKKPPILPPVTGM